MIPDRRKRLLLNTIVAVLFLLLGCVMYPGLFSGSVPWDERLTAYVATRVEAARLVKSGELPFFTPNIYAGFPLFSMGDLGVLYPPNWLYLVLRPFNAANITAVLHTVVGGLGMFLYLRSRRIVAGGAFFGALLFSCSTFFLAHQSHVPMREVALLGPWVALASRRLILRPCGVRCFQLAGAVGLQMAASYPQISMYVMLWAAVEWWMLTRMSKRFLKATGLFVVACAIGLALSAVQVTTALEHKDQTPRAEFNLGEWQNGSFTPYQVLLFADPMALGPLAFWQGSPFPAEMWCTLSSAGFALALAGSVLAMAGWRRRRSRHTLAFVACSVVAFLFALGQFFPLSAWFFSIPPFNLFRIPARWMYLVVVFVSIAAAHGIQLLIMVRPWLRPIGFVVAWLAWVGAVIGLTYVEQPVLNSGIPLDPILLKILLTDQPLEAMYFIIPLVVGVLLFLAPRRWMVVPAMAAVVFFSVEWRQLSTLTILPLSRHETVVDWDTHPLLKNVKRGDITRLYSFCFTSYWHEQQAFPPNTNLLLPLPTVSGYGPLRGERLLKTVWIDSTGVGWYDRRLLDRPSLLPLLAVSHVVLPTNQMTEEDIKIWNEGLGKGAVELGRADTLMLFRLANPRPRFEFAPMWRSVGALADAEYRVHKDPAPIDERVVVVERPRKKDFPPVDVPLPGGSVELLDEGGRWQRLKVKTEGHGVLVIRDAYWDGWEYRVDGGEYRRVHPAMGCLRAIPVLAGEHLVEFRFIPPGFGKGLALSVLSLLCWISLLIRPIKKLVTRRS